MSGCVSRRRRKTEGLGHRKPQQDCPMYYRADLALSVRFGFQRQPHPEQNVTTASNLHQTARQRLRQVSTPPFIKYTTFANISPPETNFEEVFLLYAHFCVKLKRKHHGEALHRSGAPPAPWPGKKPHRKGLTDMTEKRTILSQYVSQSVSQSVKTNP